MNKRNQRIITVIPFLLSITLFIVKMFMPSYIDAQGFLHESFYLIPLTYLSLFVGIGFVIRYFVTNKKIKMKEL